MYESEIMLCVAGHYLSGLRGVMEIDTMLWESSFC
jgi:hypothetical protein